MTWTQPLCERCWINENTVETEAGIEIRRTHHVIGDMEVCCMCGNLTIAGIYIRRDPAIVPFPREEE